MPVILIIVSLNIGLTSFVSRLRLCFLSSHWVSKYRFPVWKSLIIMSLTLISANNTGWFLSLDDILAFPLMTPSRSRLFGKNSLKRFKLILSNVADNVSFGFFE